MIEHVDSHEAFFKSLRQIVKDNGSIYLTTFNKTPISYWLAIVGKDANRFLFYVIFSKLLYSYLL